MVTFPGFFGAEISEKTAFENSKIEKEFQTRPNGGKMTAVKYYGSQIAIHSRLILARKPGAG